MNRTALLGACLLACAPTSAFSAEDLREPARPELRTAAFVGGTLRLGFGTRRPEKPQAALAMGFAHRTTDRGAAAFSARDFRVSGLQLGAGRPGKPSLRIGGSEVGELGDRLGVSTGGAIAIGAGVTLLALVAIVAASNPMENFDATCLEVDC